MAQTAVGTSAVEVADEDYDGPVRNSGTNPVFLGRNDAVTTGNGYELASDETLPRWRGALWAVAAAGGEQVDTIT